MTTRADIVRVARGYIGTRFHEYGRAPGVGLDCAGLVICAMRDTGLAAPSFDVREYSQKPDGTLLRHCDAHLVRIAKNTMQPGDAIVVVTDKDPQHLGILADYRGAPGVLSIIHASNDPRYMRVIEMRLMFSTDIRFAAAYAFPGIE